MKDAYLPLVLSRFLPHFAVGDTFPPFPLVLSSVPQIPMLHWERPITVPWDAHAPALVTYLDSITHGFVQSGQIAAIRANLGIPLPPEKV